MKWLRTVLFILLAFSVLLASSSCVPRKTKTSVDRVYELDPSGRLYIHPELQTNPPKSLAVLPFRSLVGAGRIMGSQRLFLSLNRGRAPSSEWLAREMRLTFHGQISQLPFELIHPARVDAVLEEKKLLSWEDLRALTPEEIRDLLGVEAVIFGEILNFDYYYGLLYTQIAAGLRVEMISTTSGETLWRFNDTRRHHTVRVALDPIALAVGLFQAGFSLRSINMVRAMDEICREAVATIPPPPE